MGNSKTKQYGGVVLFFCFFFLFFFVQSESPSDRPRAALHGFHPTLGKDCSLELSALMMQGNAIRQTTCCWSWQYRLPAFRAMVLWDSGCLVKPIVATYPLKPHGTTALVNLSEGTFHPP